MQAQDHDHIGGGHHRQLVTMKLAQLVQLQLDVQAHLDRVGGRQHYHFILSSSNWEP